MNKSETDKAFEDAMLYGTGFIKGGKRIAPEDVLDRGQAALDDPEPERMTEARPVGEVDREP